MTLQVVILPYCRYPWRKVALRYLLLCCLSLFLSSPLSFSHSLCLLSTSIILTPTLTLSLLPTTRYTQSTIQSSCTQTHNLLHTHFLLLSFFLFLSFFLLSFSSSFSCFHHLQRQQQQQQNAIIKGVKKPQQSFLVVCIFQPN